MNLIVKRHFSNGQSASIPLSRKGLKIAVMAGERYQLVDAATGKFPAKALVKKVGNHLVVDVDGQEAVMELTDFYTACPADSVCALDINSKTTLTTTPMSWLSADPDFTDCGRAADGHAVESNCRMRSRGRLLQQQR